MKNRFTKKEARALVDEVDEWEPRSNDDVMEIMCEIYARLPWDQPIKPANGKSFYLKKFIEPRLDPKSDGETYEFGFDAKFSNESGRIEFNCRKSGWEFAIPPGKSGKRART